MATEKQIRANRENAKRSTGPKSVGGKGKSSRNALRHGLSISENAQPQSMTVVMPEHDGNSAGSMPVELALVHGQLQRVSAVRRAMFDTLDLQSSTLDQVRRLAALDRYECRAHRLRRHLVSQLRVQ